MTTERDYLQYRIVQAAREWLEDRISHSRAEKQLMVTLFDAFPGDFSTKERCGCGEETECEECLTAEEVRQAISRMRSECSEPYRDEPAAHATPDAQPAEAAR